VSPLTEEREWRRDERADVSYDVTKPGAAHYVTGVTKLNAAWSASEVNPGLVEVIERGYDRTDAGVRDPKLEAETL